MASATPTSASTAQKPTESQPGTSQDGIVKVQACDNYTLDPKERVRILNEISPIAQRLNQENKSRLEKKSEQDKNMFMLKDDSISPSRSPRASLMPPLEDETASAAAALEREKERRNACLYVTVDPNTKEERRRLKIVPEKEIKRLRDYIEARQAKARKANKAKQAASQAV